jgi:hypothetical protein
MQNASPQNGPPLCELSPSSSSLMASTGGVIDLAAAYALREAVALCNRGDMIGSAPLESLPDRGASRRQQERRARDNHTTAAPRPARKPSPADFRQYASRPWRKVPPLMVGTAATVAVLVGWLGRGDGHLTPEDGVGYWLGIVGGGLMLLLLLYPLRKRIRSLRVLGSVATWFRLHMLLGVIGPVLILFHANFRLGSINSNVALVAMLIVAASGVVGRYLYGKIHLGLYGRKADVREILADAEAMKGQIGDGLVVADRVVGELDAFTRLVTTQRGILGSLWALPIIAIRTAVARARLLADTRRIISVEGKQLGWSRRERRERTATVAALVTLHLVAVKKAATFAFYERLFGLWHVLHLPLFFLLVLAAAVHIYAAHFY